MNFEYGTDPEFFAVDASKESEYPYIVPPAALIYDAGMPYTEKHAVTADGKPKIVKVIHVDKTFSIIEDGAAFEINIKPTNNSADFFNRVQESKVFLGELLEPYGLKVMDDIVGSFDLANFWTDRGPEFRDCVTFGCDPDKSLYRDLNTEDDGTKSIEPSVVGAVDVSTYTYRFGGGHLHIGVPEHMLGAGNLLERCSYGIAYMFDMIVHTKNVVLHSGDDEAISKEKVRLEHYGNPGRFRLQPHGFEYRPLSNWWLKDFPNVATIMANAELVFNYIREGEYVLDSFMNKFFSQRVSLYKALKQFDIDACNEFYTEASSAVKYYLGRGYY